MGGEPQPGTGTGTRDGADPGQEGGPALGLAPAASALDPDRRSGSGQGDGVEPGLPTPGAALDQDRCLSQLSDALEHPGSCAGVGQGLCPLPGLYSAPGRLQSDGCEAAPEVPGRRRRCAVGRRRRAGSCSLSGWLVGIRGAEPASDVRSGQVRLVQSRGAESELVDEGSPRLGRQRGELILGRRVGEGRAPGGWEHPGPGLASARIRRDVHGP